MEKDYLFKGLSQRYFVGTTQPNPVLGVVIKIPIYPYPKYFYITI
jgi:hypothetical protein